MRCCAAAAIAPTCWFPICIWKEPLISFLREFSEKLLLQRSPMIWPYSQRTRNPEVRASSARGLAHAEPLVGIAALSELAMDEVWFVRLRAVVSLAALRHPASLPALLSTICDINRTVRHRSASALAQLPKDLLPVIVDRVAATGDKYALHALISELERIGECSGLMLQLSDREALISDSGRNLLRAVEEARRQIEHQRNARQGASEVAAGNA